MMTALVLLGKVVDEVRCLKCAISSGRFQGSWPCLPMPRDLAVAATTMVKPRRPSFFVAVDAAATAVAARGDIGFLVAKKDGVSVLLVQVLVQGRAVAVVQSRTTSRRSAKLTKK